MKQIFVLALDRFQREELLTIRDAHNCQFHSVMDIPSLVEAEGIEFNHLLIKVRDEIASHGVPVDAIIAHWDFPTSVLVPILCKEFGVPAPSLESVLKCEHKLWSRLEQAQVVPEVVPRFGSFDPFSSSPLDEIELDFPFWIKPVKAFSSQLGFRITNKEEFDIAIEKIREKIGRLGNSFNEALEKVTLPTELHGAGGNTCLVEEIIEGVQIAPEGSVFQGQVRVHGIFDMNKDSSGTRIDWLEYPSKADSWLKDAMIDVCERLMTHIGFDNGCFNMEFMWDEKRRRLRLIEVNTRISQSHSEMFIQVDGMSNHEVAVDVALGRQPVLPYRRGPYSVAAQFLITHDRDGVVSRVPSTQELEALQKRFPHMRLKVEVEPGMRLSKMMNQSSYSYVLAELYLGASNREELLSHYSECLSALTLEVQPISEEELEAASPEKAEGDDYEDRLFVPLPGKNHREHIHTGTR